MAREEKLLYVSIWYAFGALIFTFFIYFFGNAVWNPRTGAITGMPDGILAWFYGHGVVGLFLTPLAVGLAYYVIPIVSRAPLFSHAVSLVGFWTILMFYPHIGTHHLLQTPAPTWLKIVAITGSIGMLIPVFAVLVNLWLTMRGKLGQIHADIGGKFVFAGLVWYLFVCLQGPFQALPSVQTVTHLTNWVVAHSHIAVFGFSRLYRPRRDLFHHSPHHRPAPVQPQTGRHPVLARVDRPVRLFSRSDYGRPHPGYRLAVREDGLRDPAGTSHLLGVASRVRGPDHERCGGRAL